MSTISGTIITQTVTLASGPVTTFPTYASPLTITSSGGVEVTSGNAIYGPATNAWAVANQGILSAQTAGVYLTLGGDVDNSANGRIQGAVGVRINGATGTVTNSATIVGGAFSGVGLYKGGSVANTDTGLIEGNKGVNIGGAIGTVTNSGTIMATGIGGGAIGVNLDAGGSGGGSVGNTGLIEGQYGVYIFGAGRVTNSGTIIGTGRTGVALQAGGTVVDSGTITGGNVAVYFYGGVANRLVLDPGYHLGGRVVGLGATNTLELGGSLGAALTVNYNGLTLSSFQDVLFGAGGNDTLTVANTSGTLAVTISGFGTVSDIIDLTQIGTNGTIASQSGTLVTITGSLGSVTLKGDATDAPHFRTASDLVTGTDVMVACFRRGTLILTEQGEVAVEDLAIGDKVVTLSGAARPIKWIGRRAYDPRFVTGNAMVLPIRIAAGALSDGIPVRDLLVSPEHALYLDGLLAPAGLIVNGATIRQARSVERLEYFHIELAAHDIIFAEGTPAESYVECDNRGMFHNAAEFAALYPDDTPATWQFCAPRVKKASAELSAIRVKLLARAVRLGYTTTPDPDLYLVVDGETIRAQAVEDGVYRFSLAVGGRAVWLASRSVVPVEVEPLSQDRRRLGVAVERIVLYEDGLRIEIGHGYTALRQGFHADEGSHRWTDGRAGLPAELLRPFAGDLTVEVQISPGLRYRLDPPQRIDAIA